MDKEQLDRNFREHYRTALDRLDDSRIDLGEMINLIEKQTDTDDKNPSYVEGTYLDKKHPHCPLNMCGGSRGLKIGPNTAMQCPCVKPEQLREFKNSQPQPIG